MKIFTSNTYNNLSIRTIYSTIHSNYFRYKYGHNFIYIFHNHNNIYNITTNI